MKAKLINLDKLDKQTREDLGVAMVDLMRAQEAGTLVTVDGVACEVDGTFEHDYHDVTLPNGVEVAALSGYHLQPFDLLATAKSLFNYL